MSTTALAYVLDRSLWERTNQGERDFWYAYLPEVLDQLGVKGRELEPAALNSPDRLEGCPCVLIGPVAHEQQLAASANKLEAWVQSGGVLIGLSCRGLDDLFGIAEHGRVAQPLDDFTQNGFLDLKRASVAADVHSCLHPSQRLLVFSDVRLASPVNAEVVGSYFYANGRPSPFAAVTQRSVGRGWAFYFAFDVPKTLWVLHQGRPVDKDYDGDGYFRVGDARVIGANEEEVPYADEILDLVQNMIARRPHPFVCALPPADGQVADALLYWGGDDEAGDGVQVPASQFMAERGLPYHINVMPRDGTFHLSREDADLIRANGHELAVHYNHTERDAQWRFTEEDVKRQAQLFYEAFGRRSECSVNHCCTWVLWSEPAKWMAQCGGIADNSRIHSATPPMNPTNQIGFSFGTALPYHFYDDWRSGNQRIDFISEPITAYEVGYQGDECDFATVHRAIDLAARRRSPMDMFYHPCNIAQRSSCRTAIDEALSYIRRRGLRVKHMGNDALARWWRDRSESEVGPLSLADGRLSFRTRTEHADGMVVKVPLQTGRASRCECEGKPLAFENIFELGQNWTYVAAPAGEAEVQMALQAP